MEKECYEEEVQPYRKMDYKPKNILSHTNSTLILWSQLLELLTTNDNSEDIPEVGLDIVLRSAQIADLVKNLGVSMERENSYDFNC